MKIYYPSQHYNSNYRRQVFPLLKAFIKQDGYTDVQRQSDYGVTEREFVVVDTIDQADFAILTMSWNYYSITNQMVLAYSFIEKANKAGKRIWTINNGDFGIKLPKIKNVIVFRQSGYLSNNQIGHVGFPSILSDYLTLNHLKSTYLNVNYCEKPIVGFCGLTNGSYLNASIDVMKQVLRNLRSQLRFKDFESQKLLSSSYLRARLLKTLEEHLSVDHNFIKRKHYRAGIDLREKETHDTTKQFYDNILESHYVLCARGAGNFSVRFYETLMMGRIPLYVHTDGFLPLSDIIDWKSHVVWIDYKDRHKISEILLDFHGQLDQDSLKDLFAKNRKLWEEKLTLSGFFKTQKEAF
jgi:hypothetical protein